MALSKAEYVCLSIRMGRYISSAESEAMREYIVRRIILFITTLLGASLVIFILMMVVPGNVYETTVSCGPTGECVFSEKELQAYRERVRVDHPLYVQYAAWMWDVARGDLGYSFITRRPIFDDIKQQFPVTLQLSIFTFATMLILSVPLGILAAARPSGRLDHVVRGVSMLQFAIPTFFVGLLVILVFNRTFGWMPPESFTALWEDPWVASLQLILPAVALGTFCSGFFMMLTRAQLLEALREGYAMTARGQGMGERDIIIKHGLPNVMLSVFGSAGLQFAALFSGIVLIERLFNIPGIGRGLLESIYLRDYFTMPSYFMYIVALFLTVNLVADLIYAWLDPRIRQESEEGYGQGFSLAT